MRAFGIDPAGRLAVITVVVGEGPRAPAGSTDDVEGFFARAGVPAVVVAGSQDTVVVFQWHEADTAITALAEELVCALSTRFPGDRTVVGIGDVSVGSAALREPLIGSREVCQVLRRRSAGPSVGTYADVGTHRMLLGLHDRKVLRRFADDILGPLRAHDTSHGTELEATLRCFLGNDGQWSTTAAELYVHVNTLRNRVAKIGDLTGRDVGRLEDRVDLFLALEADALG